MQLGGYQRMTGLGALVLPLLLTGCITVNVQAPSGSASPSAPASSASPSASPTSSTPETPTLGPKGFGTLALGVTKRQAVATGLVAGVTGSAGTCGESKDGRLVGADPVDNDDLAGKLFFSVNTGRLVIIGAMPGVATPEGVALGSTTAEVRAAYPSWKGYRKDNYGVGYVKAPGNAKAYYRIYVHDDEVIELTIQSLDQDCTE
ncbi:MAG: hypothetical protein LCH96_12815 [Actinobacteria bacterium]|nr:hypothetical protein [Actinomycetota bacterium]